MLLLAGNADDSALAVALHLVLAETRERKLDNAFAEFDAGIDHWPQILDIAPSVGILHHGDNGDASQPLVREASGLLEALFHDNERAPGANLHGVILTFGFRRSCALSADLSIQYADDAVRADRTKQNRMLNFNFEDRVGTIVIERVSAGNSFNEAMVRQLGEIIRRAAEEADIVTLSGAGADFTIRRDRGEPKSGSPFDAFCNISALNKAIAEFPGVLITGVRGRAFGLGFGLIMRSDIAIASANTRFALDEVKLGIPRCLSWSKFSNTRRRNAHSISFSRAANSAPTRRCRSGSFRAWLDRTTSTARRGNSSQRCARATAASCSPASAICARLAKCRPRPARLTRSWNRRNLPWSDSQ